MTHSVGSYDGSADECKQLDDDDGVASLLIHKETGFVQERTMSDPQKVMNPEFERVFLPGSCRLHANDKTLEKF